MNIFQCRHEDTSRYYQRTNSEMMQAGLWQASPTNWVPDENTYWFCH